MSLWTAEEMIAATGGSMPVPADVTGVSIDTRTLRPGDLFVALHGTTDGHAHAAEALRQGAACVLVEDTGSLPPAAPALIVADTLLALQALGRAGRGRFRGRLIAVTGSVGKTTTKEMLRVALGAFGPTHAAEASYNNHWGVPLTLARLPPDAAFCVSEIGMNTAGEILPLATMAAPDIAVITTIGTAHIGRMGSLEAIAREKASLLDGLRPDGVAVLPAEGPYASLLASRAPGRFVTFGLEAGDVHATTIKASPDASHVQAVVAGQTLEFRLSVPGTHMVMNALAVLGACHAAGLDLRQAATALAEFKPMPGRGQQRAIHGGDIILLDESYNASSASMRAALDVLRGLRAHRRLAVLGDMLEMGPFGESEHAGLAGDVARAADLLYACGPLTRSLFDRVPPALRGAHVGDAETLAPIVAAAVRAGDAVLVKGSLGSRMRVVVRALEQSGTSTPPGGAG